MNILLHRVLPPDALAALDRIAPGAVFRLHPGRDGLEAQLDWAEVVFGNPPAALLAARPNLRWLQIVSSGFDEYDALAGSGMVVTTAHGVHARPIAQQVVMALLMFSRGQLHFGECQRVGKWDRNPRSPSASMGRRSD